MQKNKIVFFTLISLTFITAIYFTLFDTFRISSGSMADTILPGDFILSKSYESSIKRGRIILFTSPTERDVTYIKRCIALSGDTLEIRDAIVFVNGVEQASPPTVKNYYCISYADDKKTLETLKQLNILVDEYDETIKTWLTNDEAKVLISKPYIESVLPFLLKSNSTQTFFYGNKLPIFLTDSTQNWTLHNYGPIVIPFKGMSIDPKLSVDNAYLKLIRNQFATWNADSNSIKLNEDFFFKMGDNRDNSIDSRHFGFIPQTNIKGSALMIVLSRGPNGVRWERILKHLN